MKKRDVNPVPIAYRGKMITAHFSYDELLRSSVAEWRNRYASVNDRKYVPILNAPGAEEMTNLKHLAEQLEWLRERVGAPLNINSGYRSKTINYLVGGSMTSRHLFGLAADIRCSDLKTCAAIARRAVANKYAAEVLISCLGEKGAETWWLHFSVFPEGVQGRPRFGVDINGLIAAFRVA